MRSDVYEQGTRDPHDVLGVPRGADRQQVMRAFHRKARRGGHPDTGGDAQTFDENHPREGRPAGSGPARGAPAGPADGTRGDSAGVRVPPTASTQKDGPAARVDVLRPGEAVRAVCVVRSGDVPEGDKQAGDRHGCPRPAGPVVLAVRDHHRTPCLAADQANRTGRWHRRPRHAALPLRRHASRAAANLEHGPHSLDRAA